MKLKINYIIKFKLFFLFLLTKLTSKYLCFIKILLELIAILIIIKINNNKIVDIINIKVCICTIGKKENKYITEFVSYYKKLGIDKIFLYDNNDLNDESFYNVINDYVKNKFVEIIDFRGIIKPQKKSMNDCYKKNYLKFNWLLFYDLDEFLYLKNFTNIKYFLNQPKFNKCKIIRLNLVYFTDNNFLYYENKSLSKRFQQININIKGYIIKSIIRGNIKGVKIIQCHYLIKIKGCNEFGTIVNKISSKSDIIDLKNYFIKHYAFKSTEEFINKIKRGDAIAGKTKEKMLNKINIYFRYNFITLKKINLIKKKTGLNLNKFKNKLKYINKNKRFINIFNL